MKLLGALVGLFVATNLSLATESMDEAKYQFDIKVGLTAKELHANAQPDSVQRLTGGVIEEYPLHNGTADLLIVDGKVVQVDYHKGGTEDLPFNEHEIQTVQKVNAMGSSCVKINEKDWVLENYKAYLLYGQFTDESKNVLVVITPKAVTFWTNLNAKDKKKAAPPSKHPPETLPAI